MYRLATNLFRRYRKPFEEYDNLIIGIDNSWSNDYGIGIQGWIISKQGDLDEVEIEVNGATVPITSWYPRPEVRAAYPQFNFTDNCGFWVHIPRLADHHVTFKAKKQRTTWTKSLAFKGSKPQEPVGFPEGVGIFADFVKLVNDNHLSVLEIGSRIVSPGSSSKRAFFPGASSYTGFDYYPDSNTDVVGDAHKLSQYFDNQLFDAIFSQSVFEHLAMPWVVAMEINKLLKVGGITCHSTHNAWPAHERPWDFWRFSEDGLKVLFSQPLGFQTLKAGLFEPLRMHLDNVTHPHHGLEMIPGFGGVAILATKIADVNSEQFKWNVTLEDVLGTTSHYPKPKQN